MALKGNLSNFGIADVLQLIGTQNKTATLQLQNKNEQITMSFLDGALVNTMHVKRQRQELLGNMLLRAELITPSQLQQAIGNQQFSKVPIGKLLVEMNVLQESDLIAFLKLQSTETVFRSFLWNEGTYVLETNQQIVPIHAPVRAEILLMDGFRQRDEWPLLRQKIQSYRSTFKIKSSLEEFLLNQDQASVSKEADPFDMSWDNNEEVAVESDIPPNERLVYSLIADGRDTQKIIDMSRLGEFATCQALTALLDKNILEIEHIANKASAEPVVGGIEEEAPMTLTIQQRLHQGLYVSAACLLFGVVCFSGLSYDSIWYDKRHVTYPTLLLFVQEANKQRMVQEVAWYRYAHNELPQQLEQVSKKECLSWSGWLPCNKSFLYQPEKNSYRIYPLLP